MLKLIDTFSGIGGFSLAAEQIVGGFETVAFVECEPYCQKILKKHWPTVPIYDDIRTYKPEPYSASVIVGGFPCQDLSVAGRGEGIKKDTRSGLFYELIRVIRLVRPRFVVLENVSAILNNGLDIVLGELYKAGYDAEWACFPASMVGACHQRDRWWAIAYPTSAGTWENEHRLWRQSQRGCLQADRDSNQQISKSTSNSTSFRSRTQGEIQAGGNSLNGSIASHSKYNGSSSPEKSRSIEETNGRSKKRQNEIGKLEGSSQSRNSETVQLDVANSKIIGMEGMRSSWQQIQPRLGKEGLPKWRYERNMLSPDWRSYTSEPVLRRGDDGLSNRVDRLRALGNTVLPACAAIPLQRVLDLHNEQSRNKDPAGNKTCTRKDQEPSSVP